MALSSPVGSPRSTLNTSSQLRRSGRISLTQAEHIRYDAKYHPVDEAIRPKAAAARRNVFGAESPIVIDDVDITTDESDTTMTEDMDSNGNEDSDTDGSHSKKQGMLMTPRSPPRGSRHSERIAAQDNSPFSYSQKVHPQDDLLRKTGVIGRRRSCILPTKKNNDSTSSRSRRSSTASTRNSHKRTKRRASMPVTQIDRANEYASAYLNAWEALAPTKPESFETVREGYIAAWENLAASGASNKHMYSLEVIPSSSRESSEETQEGGHLQASDCHTSSRLNIVDDFFGFGNTQQPPSAQHWLKRQIDDSTIRRSVEPHQDRSELTPASSDDMEEDENRVGSVDSVDTMREGSPEL